MQYLDDLLVLAIILGALSLFYFAVRSALKSKGLLHGLYVLSLILAPIAIVRIVFTGVGVASGPTEPWLLPGAIVAALIPIALWYASKRSD
jgi:hypothetical protein